MSLLALVPHAVGQQQTQVIYGEVSANQPVPRSLDDPLYVVMPDFSVDEFWTIQPGDWDDSHGGALPGPGSACLLVFDSRGNLKVAQWSGRQGRQITPPRFNKLANFLLSS